MKFLWTSPLVRNMETSTSPHYQKQLQMNCNADSWASNSKRSLDVSCKCLLKKKLSLIILNIVWVVWQDRGSLNDKCTRRPPVPFCSGSKYTESDKHPLWTTCAHVQICAWAVIIWSQICQFLRCTWWKCRYFFIFVLYQGL